MKLVKSILIATAISGLISTTSFAKHHGEKKLDLVQQGEKIFNTKKLGNCNACHAVNGKDISMPGSMGPKLQYLSAWPEQALYDKIFDPYTTNPVSVMPAFGKNAWLSDAQIKAVVAYLKTVN